MRLASKREAANQSAQMTTRRWEVLSALAECLARKGYYAVGMRELALAAGLNPGTLYHHFTSKDDALLSICLVAHKRTFNDLKVVMQGKLDFRGRIEAYLDAHCRSLDEIGDYLQVYINLRGHVPPEMARPLDEGWTKFRRLLARLFAEAKAAGEIPPDIDPKHLGRLLVGMIRVINQLHRAGRRREVRRFANLASRVLVRGLSKGGECVEI